MTSQTTVTLHSIQATVTQTTQSQTTVTLPYPSYRTLLRDCRRGRGRRVVRVRRALLRGRGRIQRRLGSVRN